MVLPKVTLLIAAYNQREILMEKVRNCYGLDYPPDLLELAFVTDGSTDGSEDLLFDLPLVRVFHTPLREGRLAAISRAIHRVTSPIIVLTDADCMLNPESIYQVVRHFNDPLVGAVTGEIKYLGGKNGPKPREQSRFRYDAMINQLESDFNSAVGASGGLFSFRRELFHELPEDVIFSDFVLSLDIASRGYRVIYEPNAFAEESMSTDLEVDWKKRVKTCAGGFQALKMYLFLLSPKRFSVLGFQFLSQRFLRLAVIPFILPLVFVLSFWQAYEGITVYQYFFAIQAAGYATALLGFLYQRIDRIPSLIDVPFQFVMSNAAAYAGLIRFLKGNSTKPWEPSISKSKA